jgi:hypothetical protein
MRKEYGGSYVDSGGGEGRRMAVPLSRPEGLRMYGVHNKWVYYMHSLMYCILESSRSRSFFVFFFLSD